MGVTGFQTCALPIPVSRRRGPPRHHGSGVQDAPLPRARARAGDARGGRSGAVSALRDQELLDLHDERGDLLAVADAVASSRGPRRRTLPRLLAAAAVVAAATAAALLAPSERGPDV